MSQHYHHSQTPVCRAQPTQCLSTASRVQSISVKRRRAVAVSAYSTRDQQRVLAISSTTNTRRVNGRTFDVIPNLDARHKASVMFYVCLSVISLVVVTYVDRKAGSAQVSAKLFSHPSTNCELVDGRVTNLALSRASVPYLLDTRSVMWLMCDLTQTRACGKPRPAGRLAGYC